MATVPTTRRRRGKGNGYPTSDGRPMAPRSAAAADVDRPKNAADNLTEGHSALSFIGAVHGTCGAGADADPDDRGRPVVAVLLRRRPLRQSPPDAAPTPAPAPPDDE